VSQAAAVNRADEVLKANTRVVEAQKGWADGGFRVDGKADDHLALRRRGR
jgi:hypothetical protein